MTNEVTQFNVGRWCLSEDDCIAAGINFAGYERGVSDAAEAFGRNSRQSERVKELERDAARYRWLRDCGPDWQHLNILDQRGSLVAESLDAAIDAAMKEQQ